MVFRTTIEGTTKQENKELLCALERSIKERIVLQEVAQIATNSPNLESVVNISLDKVVELLSVETAAIILADEQGDGVTTITRGGSLGTILDSIKGLSVGNTITSRIALSDIPVVIEDILKYPHLVDDPVKQEGLRSIAAVPLKSSGQVIGTLIIASHSLHSFSSEDISLLNTIGEGLGPALKNAELYETLHEKIRQLDIQNKELVKQQQRLLEKTKEAKAASKLKSEFLASMSHELRTPLNVIIGFSELMLDEIPGKVNDEQRQCLDDVLTSSRHLLQLINEVFDLSKLETSKLELSMTTVSLKDVTKWLRKTVMPILAPKKQALDIVVEDGLPPVYGDEIKIKQVLLNLLSNSAKFTPDGGKIRIEVIRKDNQCYVSVIDNGIGIKREDKERIFEPFYQANTTIASRKNGAGLGLAISKKIVERHGGQIWVESQYGRRSRFTFTLPLSVAC